MNWPPMLPDIYKSSFISAIVLMCVRELAGVWSLLPSEKDLELQSSAEVVSDK